MLETTGLADPAPLLQTAMAHPYLVMRYRLDGVVTVVDAINGGATLDAAPGIGEAGRGRRPPGADQDRSRRHAGAQRAPRRSCWRGCKALNPAAPVLDAAAGEATPDALLDCGLYDPDAQDSRRRPLARRRGLCGARTITTITTTTSTATTTRIRAFTFATDTPIPAATFEMFIDLVRSLHGPKLLRLKGIVKIAETPDEPLVIHGVQHVMHPPARLERWPDADRRTRIVLIARDLAAGGGHAAVRRLRQPRRARPPGYDGTGRQSADPVRRRRSLINPALATICAVTDAFRAVSCVDGVGTASGIAMGFIERLTADLISLGGALRALRNTTHIAKNPTRVFPQLIEELAEKYGDAPALLSDRETLQLSRARRALEPLCALGAGAGHRQGRHVCLLMPNRPEFLAIWLGITRVGGVVALLNTNLIGTSLAHCINIVDAASTSSSPPRLLAAFAIGAAASHVERQGLAARRRRRRAFRASTARSRICPATPLADSERRALTIEDRALFIYTSGTTGLPKAANINHYRLMLATHALRRRHGHARRPTACTTACRCITPPAACCATGALLLNGGSVVIRERFSAREFWDDMVRWDCTLLQYIGELCRYLVNSPPHPKETQAQAPARLRQRPASRHLAGVQAALPDPARSSSSTPRPKAT